MMGGTHAVVGMTAGAAAAIVCGEVFDISPMLQTSIVAAATIGGLLPDIDHPNSMASKKFPLIAIPYRIIAWISKLLGIKGLGHRGLTHYFETWIVIGLILYFTLSAPIALAIGLGVVLGAISHIWADAHNSSGIPSLFCKRIHLLPKKLRIPTKSFEKKKKKKLIYKEDVFCSFFILINAILLWVLLR